MTDQILKKYKELRGIIRKFVSSDKKDPEAFLDKVKKWSDEIQNMLSKESKKGKQGKEKEKDEKKDE